MLKQASIMATLAAREKFREEYGRERDSIFGDRMLWRAQTFRHLVQPLPGQRILELGCGRGVLTRQLDRVCRGRNPITAITFDPEAARPENLPGAVEFLSASALPEGWEARRYDFVIATDLLDRRHCAEVLQAALEILKPGGEVVFYESNPWNPVLRLRHAIGRLFGGRDSRELLSRPTLYELISELGYIRVFAVFNDFVYWPLTRRLSWLLRNLSILLENAPGIRTLAGSILVHAQKPPRIADRPRASLFEYESMRGAVSVVVPCHNEEMNVEPLVARLKELYGDYLREIVLVDDNSRDGTRRVIESLAALDGLIKPIIRTPPNGVGLAIADGLRAATGEWVLSMDCDFQHLLPTIRDLFDSAVQGYDVVVGSRFSRHSVLLNYPFQKIVANRGFHALAQLVLRMRFRDLTNNLKLMRREVVQQLDLRQPGFAVNAETGLQPLLLGFSVKEAPISWVNRTPDQGASSFRLIRVGGGYWRVLFDLWKLLNLNAGPYTIRVDRGSSRTTWREMGSPDVRATPTGRELAK
jgi:dolichol-phosphate mannosyltransferase